MTSTASELSPEQIATFNSMLRERRGELHAEIAEELRNSDSQQHREFADRIQDAGEEAIAQQLVDVNLSLINHHQLELNDIEAALMRIADGRYGICVSCRENIVPARLTSYPTAKRCHECQQTHEQKGTPR